MSKALRVAAWAALFLACAGVGAYIAAHSDPFPPGVDRPGASALASASTSPSGPPAPERWVGSFRSFTYHQLYVGGRCTTRWRGDLRFAVDAETGAVEGTGAARLFGALECDFPIAQVQAERVELAITGRMRDGSLRLHLSQTGIEPSSARDYGGFTALLPVRITLPVGNDAAEDRVVRRRIDEEGRGIYFWSTGLQLAKVEV
jgi:hypothetical protein